MDLLKVANPENLTDEEIIRFRAWLRDAYEKAGQGTAELEEIPSPAPVPAQTSSPRAANPNPEALGAMYARIAWFLAKRERAGTAHAGGPHSSDQRIA